MVKHAYLNNGINIVRKVINEAVAGEARPALLLEASPLPLCQGHPGHHPLLSFCPGFQALPLPHRPRCVLPRHTLPQLQIPH